MACNGTVFISLKHDPRHAHLSFIEFSSLGLPNVFHQNTEHFNVFIENYLSINKLKDVTKFKEELRIAVRKYFDGIVGYKPTTQIHIVSL